MITSAGPWVELEHHRTIGSTNVRAAGLGAWRVVVADHQSLGRGRLLRSWQAPPDTSVAVSATVPMPAAGSGWLPLLAGVAVLEAIEATSTARGSLKWPNDVLLDPDGRKVCGILCEVSPSGTVVIGAGINISQGRDDLPVSTATSLALAGATVDRTALVTAYLTRLGELYAVLAAGGPGAARTRARYRRRCSTIGRQVALSQASGPDVEGVAVEVDEEGRLVIEAGGARRPWAAGDVVHVRPRGGDLT